MKAAETMAERSRLHGLLTAVDNNITMKVGEPNRVNKSLDTLLRVRARVCTGLIKVGYEPPPVPIDIDESRVK